MTKYENSRGAKQALFMICKVLEELCPFEGKAVKMRIEEKKITYAFEDILNPGLRNRLGILMNNELVC